jgi:erythromycin esterase-like protein
MRPSEANVIESVAAAAQPLAGGGNDYGQLLAAVGDARFVLLGEASHGTEEFYEARAQITRRLIEEGGVTAVVAEADWPDAWRVNRFVRGFDDDEDADAALAGFRRFPQWMWRNAVVLDFINWLRQHNEALPRGQPKVGFYGMDLYSLYGSMAAVLQYLDKVDPNAAKRARFRYGCFEHFGEDAQAYGYAAARFDLGRDCEGEVVQQLLELRSRAADYARRDGRVAEDEYFYAEQNARLIKNAEQYYRTMFEGRTSSWNLRDRHMVETLEALVSHLDHHVGRTKVVVWAHNSHLGYARATDSATDGQLNVGQLVRERWGAESFLAGFTTHEGTVTAASDWDAPAERKRVRESLSGSYERVFHNSGVDRFLLMLSEGDPRMRLLLQEPRLERAIGVIYRPETERLSHYFHARLPDQFDAVIHFDRTTALRPLEPVATWESAEVDETYPTGV